MGDDDQMSQRNKVTENSEWQENATDTQEGI
jgi:hypothetical protein